MTNASQPRAPESATRKDKSGENSASRMNFTKARLDAEDSKRQHRQKVIWDTEEKGLCVLVSRGPKREHKATVTFRVVYYLPSHPGKPLYLSLGRYPDGEYTYPYKDEK